MGQRSDEQAGDAPPPDPSHTPVTDRSRDGRPLAEPDEPETEKAKTEIEAGDVADELADFA